MSAWCKTSLFMYLEDNSRKVRFRESGQGRSRRPAWWAAAVMSMALIQILMGRLTPVPLSSAQARLPDQIGGGREEDVDVEAAAALEGGCSGLTLVASTFCFLSAVGSAAEVSSSLLRFDGLDAGLKPASMTLTPLSCEAISASKEAAVLPGESEEGVDFVGEGCSPLEDFSLEEGVNSVPASSKVRLGPMSRASCSCRAELLEVAGVACIGSLEDGNSAVTTPFS